MAARSFPERDSDPSGSATSGSAGVHLSGSAGVGSSGSAGVNSSGSAASGSAGVGRAEAEARCGEILRAARGWIGTPYVHQASRKGAGCDCLGLIRGIWREVVGTEPESPPFYSADWGEAQGKELLLAAAFRRLRATPEGAERIGDVILFRWRPGGLARHAGILAPEGKVIHAWEQAGVVEVEMPPAWRRRIAGFFRFPASRLPESQSRRDESSADLSSAGRPPASRSRRS